MPVCPSCKTFQVKRKKSACPACGERVSVYKGQWVREELGSPTVALLKHFERRVSGALSAGRDNKVVFTIPPKGLSYRREMVSAERLLSLAGNDYDLAVAAIDILFDDKRFSFRTRTSLMYLEKEYLVTLAIAKANQEAAEQRAREQSQAILSVLAREDIFS